MDTQTPNDIAILASGATVEVYTRGAIVRTAEWTARIWRRDIPSSAYDAKRYSSNTRVYGATEALADPEIFAAHEASTQVKPHSYTSSDGETVHVTQASIDRKYKSIKARMLGQVRPRVMDILAEIANIPSLNGKATTAKFSMKASCSCPCSPGHTLDARLTLAGAPVDIWIDRTPTVFHD